VGFEFFAGNGVVNRLEQIARKVLKKGRRIRRKVKKGRDSLKKRKIRNEVERKMKKPLKIISFKKVNF
jgi:hypothetical protein